MFEWDGNKNRLNISKHKLDFIVVKDFAWHDAILFDRSRREDGETRHAAIGMFDGKLHTVIFHAPRQANARRQFPPRQHIRGEGL